MNSSYTSGIISFNESIDCGVLIPATTSSPCAFIKNSPYRLFSPVAGFLVNATPVPEVFPLLPYTISCTFTAVPQSCGISFILLYTSALSLFHDLNTALTASRSWTLGSCGKSFPFSSLYRFLNLITTSNIPFASSSLSNFTLFFSFTLVSISSNLSLSNSSTTSAYISMNLLYESHTNLGSFVNFISPDATLSLIPRFSIVSIIPGMDARDPLLTDTSNGFDGSPNFLYVAFSKFDIYSIIWFFVSSSIFSLFL